ncbi:nucleolin-like [Channa argus]|uniref:nucleolin-like n=1 Tax=Channa argus TaxID=215402 RepID=UPI003522A59E
MKVWKEMTVAKGEIEAVLSAEQTVGTEEDSPTESSYMKQDEKDKDEQGSLKKNTGKEDIDFKRGITTSDQMSTKDMMGNEAQAQAASSADAIECTESAHSENPEAKMEQEIEDIADEQVKRKRKSDSDVELSPSKIINDDLASELDLTKALMLNGEMILDKPMRMAKAKVKIEDKVKMKAPLVDKKVKDARCLFLRNIPYNTTKKQILKIFHKAIAVRFPGGTKSPSKGIAFVEFRNKTIARKVLQKKQGVKIQGRVLILDNVGETKVTKANNEDNNTKAAVPPNNTLFVNKLSYNVTEKTLREAFQNAVSVNMPQNEGKPRGFAFVEFATVVDAEKALQSSQSIKICKKAVQVQFCEKKKSENAKVQLKTLIIMGLAEKTSAETLKSAFEGALSARVIVDKDTGVSKRFGFVDFESEENCKAVKEAMEDCEIDGSKVTVAYAKHKDKRGLQGAREGLEARPGGQPPGRLAGHGGPRGGKGSRGGNTMLY